MAPKHSNEENIDILTVYLRSNMESELSTTRDLVKTNIKLNIQIFP